jgi:hypothetical protein
MTTTISPTLLATLALATGPARRLGDRLTVGRETPANDTGKISGMDELKVFAKALRARLGAVVKALGPGHAVSVRCSWSTHTPALRVAFTMPGSVYTEEYQALLDSKDWTHASERRREIVLAGGQIYNDTAKGLADKATTAIRPVYRCTSDIMADYCNVNFWYSVSVNGTEIRTISE